MADRAGRDRARRAARRANRQPDVQEGLVLPPQAPLPELAEPVYQAQIAALELRIAELQRLVHAERHAEPAALPVVADQALAAPGPAPEMQIAGVTPQVMLTLRKAMPKYTGSVSYDAYRRTFDDLTRYYPAMTDQQRFELLSSALQGDTLTLLEDLGAQRTFEHLDKALNASYTKQVHAWSEMRNLQLLKQSPDETLEAWSTRVVRATRRAFPDTPDARVEEYCVQYFLSGLHDADVKSGVAGIACATMSGALDACRLARARLGPHTANKKARVAVVAETAVVDLAKDQPTAGPSKAPQAIANHTPVLSKLDELAAKLTAAVNQATAQKAPSPSTPDKSATDSQGKGKGNGKGESRKSKDRRLKLCFNCHQRGHFAAQCHLGQPQHSHNAQAVRYVTMTAPQQQPVQILYAQSAALPALPALPAPNNPGIIYALPAPAQGSSAQSTHNQGN